MIRHQGCRAAAAPGAKRSTSSVRMSTTTRASSGQQPVDIRDSRNLPVEVLKLQATNPNKFAVTVLGGEKFAWTSAGPGVDLLWAADPQTVGPWFESEWENAQMTNWPETISNLLGPESMATTRSAERHTQLRGIFGSLLSDAEVARMAPGIQAIVRRRMDSWAAAGSVRAFDELLFVVFEVIINEGLQLGWPQEDIKHFGEVFEVWNQGFTPRLDPAPDSAYSRGMAARVEIAARFKKALRDPKLKPGSIPAKLRDAFGADSDVCVDNLIMFVFAGFETTASAATNLLMQLSQHPNVLSKLRAEHQAVKAAAGSVLTLDALAKMTYTRACIREVLRMTQIVANVPRVTVKAVTAPATSPQLPAKCPFFAAWGGMSVLDPAVKADSSFGAFRPDRWLDPKNAASLEEFQHPFGWGTHSCLGARIAMTTCSAVAMVLARRFELQADTNTEISDFPTGGRPKNGLPLCLSPRKA